MMPRRVFFSLHHRPDNWRAAKVRNIGAIDGNKPATGNAWETVKKGGDAAIKRWIASQMSDRSCVIVLSGAETAGRKWIGYEIEKAWNDGKGLLGIHVNKLTDAGGNKSAKGVNPFAKFNVNGKPLTSFVRCHTPAGRSSAAVYDDIADNIEDWIEEAIAVRG